MPDGDGTQAEVLCVVDRRRSNPMARLLRQADYSVTECFSADHAVALAVANNYAVVVLDQRFLVETDGWSVAQSLKLVRPQVCVVLVCRALPVNQGRPAGVDALVSGKKPDAIVRAIRLLLEGRGDAATA